MMKEFLDLFDWIDLPAVVLGLLMLMGAYIMFQAQKRRDFDFGNMLKDESNKESALRLGVIIGISIGSWSFIYVTIHKVLSEVYWFYSFVAYLLILSGAKLAEKLIEAWRVKWNIPSNAKELDPPKQPETKQ
jgi:cbb3-type cytochrome oxidase subunit 3